MFEILLCMILLSEVVDYSNIIDVSKETTVITEPLADDGLPDYEAYLLRESSEGVTPVNNAAVLLWEVLWPEGIEEEYQGPMRAALELSPRIDETPKLIRINDESLQQSVLEWLVEQYSQRSGSESQTDELSRIVQDNPYLIQDVIDLSQNHVWTSQDLPPLLSGWRRMSYVSSY